MRLLLLALLGFLAVFINGQGLLDEDGVADVAVDVNSLGELGRHEEIITSVQKREAEAGKKDRIRQNSKRRTRKQNRKSKVNEAKRSKRRKERRKSNQRNKQPKNKRNSRRKNNVRNKSKRKTKSKGYKRNQRKNQVAKENRKRTQKRTKSIEKKNQKKKQQRKGKAKWRKNRKERKKQRRKTNKQKIRQMKKEKLVKHMIKNEKSTKKRKDGNDKSGRVLNCSDCVIKLAQYSRTYEGKCGSVLRQYRRIQSFEKITKSKLTRRGSFVPTYKSMLSALGGNQSSPHCNGEDIGSNSSSKAYTDALSTLNTCESTINSTCPELLDEALNKTLTDCYNTALRFRSAFSKCLNSSVYKTQEEICGCVEGISSEDVETLRTCDTKTQSKKQKKAKKECTDKFLECKKAEDLTVEGHDTCRKPVKCGGAVNPKDAEEELALAMKIKAALEGTEKCHGQAMSSLGLTSGPGDDGQVPNNSSRVLLTKQNQRILTRQARQAAEQGCKELEKLWEKFNQSADATARKFSDKLNTSGAADTTAILAEICARNLTADLSSCAKETRQITGTVSIVIVRIRIYIFWCRQWLLLIEIKITIITATFGLSSSPSPTPSPAPAPPTSTRRTARRLNEVLTNLKNKRMAIESK